MIEFRLDWADPQHRAAIEKGIGALSRKYPQARLKLVRLFEPGPHDWSMANTEEPGVISFSTRWFCQPPAFLEANGLHHAVVLINGRKIGWHGPMVEEPQHVIVHEFGHALALGLPRWREWAQPRWEAATADVKRAPTGYACDDPQEFWGEAFALCELGFASREMAGSLAEVLGR